MNNQKYAKYADKCQSTSNGWIKTNQAPSRKVKIDYLPALIAIVTMFTIVYFILQVI